MTMQESIYSDLPVRAAVRETVAAAADMYGDPTDEDDWAAADDVEADSDPDTDMAEDEAITTLMLAISARAATLGLERREGLRAGTVAALQEIASLADEALAAAGARPAETAPAGGWTLWNAPNGARALGPVEPGAPVDGGEWLALGVDAMWVLISPLDVASKGVTRSAEWLAGCGGRLTLLPVGHVPAVAPELADDSDAGRLASHAASLAALAAELDTICDDGVIVTMDLGSGGQPQALIHYHGRTSSFEVLRAAVARWSEVKPTACAWDSGRLCVALRPVIGGVTAKVQFVLAADDETAARTWLAELGVEVTE